MVVVYAFYSKKFWVATMFNSSRRWLNHKKYINYVVIHDLFEIWMQGFFLFFRTSYQIKFNVDSLTNLKFLAWWFSWNLCCLMRCFHVVTPPVAVVQFIVSWSFTNISRCHNLGYLFAALGAYSIVEMLFSSSLLAIVGAGEQVYRSKFSIPFHFFFSVNVLVGRFNLTLERLNLVKLYPAYNYVLMDSTAIAVPSPTFSV